MPSQRRASSSSSNGGASARPSLAGLDWPPRGPRRSSGTSSLAEMDVEGGHERMDAVSPIALDPPIVRRRSVMSTVVNAMRGIVSRMSVVSATSIMPVQSRPSFTPAVAQVTAPQIRLEGSHWAAAQPVPEGATALGRFRTSAHMAGGDPGGPPDTEDGAEVAERLLSGTSGRVLDSRLLVFSGGLEGQYLQSRLAGVPLHLRFLAVFAALVCCGYLLFILVTPPWEDSRLSPWRTQYRDDGMFYAAVAGAAANGLLALAASGSFLARVQARNPRLLLTLLPMLASLPCVLVPRFMTGDPSASLAWLAIVMAVPLMRERVAAAVAALAVATALNVAQVATADGNSPRMTAVVVLPMTLAAVFPGIAVYEIERRMRWQWLAMRKAEATAEDLRREKQQMEKLLSHQLPASIIARMRTHVSAPQDVVLRSGDSDKRPASAKGPVELAERIASVAVVFVELAHWYDRTQSIAPDMAVAILNSIFTRFDTLTELYGVEKIKTMGPCYLACSGAPLPRARHTEVIVRFALQLLEEWRDEGEKMGLDLRVGVHTGEVVAGIVGTLRFCYDIYGDTVNTASRMCKYGAVNRIHCTQQVRDELARAGGYTIECAGTSEFKGKGAMTTYFVTATTNDPSTFTAPSSPQQSPPTEPSMRHSHTTSRTTSSLTGTDSVATFGSKQTVSSSEYSAALATFSETIRVSRFLAEDPATMNAQVAAMVAALSPRGSFSMPVLTSVPQSEGTITVTPPASTVLADDPEGSGTNVAAVVRTLSSHSSVSRRSFSVGDKPAALQGPLNGVINPLLPGMSDTIAAIRNARQDSAPARDSSTGSLGKAVAAEQPKPPAIPDAARQADAAAAPGSPKSSGPPPMRRQSSGLRLPRSMSGRDLTPFAEEPVARTASTAGSVSSTSIAEEEEDVHAVAVLESLSDEHASASQPAPAPATEGNVPPPPDSRSVPVAALSPMSRRGSLSNGGYRKLSHLSAAGVSSDEALGQLENAMRSTRMRASSGDLPLRSSKSPAPKTVSSSSSGRGGATSSSLISRDLAMKLALSSREEASKRIARSARMSRFTLRFQEAQVERAFRMNGVLHSRRMTALYFAVAWALMLALCGVDVVSRSSAPYNNASSAVRFAVTRAAVATVTLMLCGLYVLLGPGRMRAEVSPSDDPLQQRERHRVMSARESQPVCIVFLTVYISLLLGLEWGNGALGGSVLCGMDVALLYVDCLLLGMPSMLVRSFLGFAAAYTGFVIVVLAVGTTSLNLASALLCMGCLFVAGLTHYVSERRRRRQFSLDMQTVDREFRIRAEKRVGEQLLFNILPASIARLLAENSQSNTARSFSAVTVLAMDIAGFTALSSMLSAREVVDLLNNIFNRFDQKVKERPAIEKIATIGDAYIAASGVPEPYEDHVFETCSLGVEMLHAVVEYNDEHLTTVPVRIRIGIHSGSCIAGILGGKVRFKYDLYGDAVHVAQTLEQTGVPGCIHITNETLALLDPMRLLSTHQFTVDERMEPIAVHSHGIERVVRTSLLHHIIQD